MNDVLDFALRDININEELTFDYQFERYGTSRHPCFCGSKNCRKWLGSKQIKIQKSVNGTSKIIIIIVLIIIQFVIK